jgi:outer membrane protein, multidrug efflux system
MKSSAPLPTALVTLATLATFLTGACTVGPNYRRPIVQVPSGYRGAPAVDASPSDEASLGDQKWWDVFNDPVLQDLIATAVRQNFDVRIAAARMLQAQAQLGIVRADQAPSVNGAVDATRERLAQSLGLPALQTSVLEVQVSAAWELDFWGKFRRATEAARAELLASEWGQRAVVTSLVSEVAGAYFTLRALDLDLDIARRTLTTRRESLRLTEVRAQGGATSLLDVRQAEQLVFGGAAVIVSLERQIEQQENFISILLGNNPSSVARGRPLIDQPNPPDVPTGLPSALIERRPDISAAEQRLIAANADIGVARAVYFPQIVLTGAGGWQSTALSSLFSGPAGIWSVGGALVQPIFTAGRTRSRVELAVAQREEATLVYQQTIQQALRDVSDALVAYRKGRELREQEELLARSASDARRLAELRYQGGTTSYLEVLDSDSRLFVAELELAAAQLNELLALVQIYRSLGGGWQM